MAASWDRQKLRQAALTAFILLHLAIMVAWNLPPSPLRNAFVLAVQPYVLWAGLWQGWDVFANPSRADAYLVADIAYPDGSHDSYEFPRLIRTGPLLAYLRSRSFNWQSHLLAGGFDLAAQDACRYLARRYTVGRKRPARVQMWAHYWPIPPPADDPLPWAADTDYSARFLRMECRLQP